MLAQEARGAGVSIGFHWRGGLGYFRGIELFKADRHGEALAGLLTLGHVPGEA